MTHLSLEGRRPVAFSLVEVSVALAIGGLVLSLALGCTARCLAAAARRPWLAANPGLERLRQDIRQSRALFYPTEHDRAGSCLVLRVVTGEVVFYHVAAGCLWREELANGGPSTARVVLEKTDRLAVQVSRSPRSVVRVGLAGPDGPVVLAAAPLGLALGNGSAP